MKREICFLVLLVFGTACSSQTENGGQSATTQPNPASLVTQGLDGTVKGHQGNVTEAVVTLTPAMSTSTKTPFPTSTITPTPFPTPIGSDLNSLIPYFRGVPYDASSRFSYTSPEGKWIVSRTSLEASDSEEYYIYYRLEISSLDGTISYNIYEQVHYYGLGGLYPYILSWSNSETTAYLTEANISDGCVVFYSYSGLSSINLETGETKPLASGYLGPAEVSPNGQWLAKIPAERLSDQIYGPKITNLIDGSITNPVIPLAGANMAGSLIWSPDSNELAFTVVRGGCEQNQQHAIVVLNLETMKMKTARGFESTLILTYDWNADGLILKETERGREYEEAIVFWLVDLETGELSPYQPEQ